MKISLVCALLAGFWMSAPAQEYRPALPGYHYEFPRDNFNHPDYQTEWWYYTGNLRAKDGHRFGFELTFFRQAVSRKPSPSPWFIHDLYMAHLALSDVTGKRYYATERVNRTGPGIAGVSAASGTIWNGNWQTRISQTKHQLRGIGEDFAFELTLSPEKQPVIHGQSGVSQKAEGAGHASHYISFTSMRTAGTVNLNGREYQVDGDAWMDHEFFSDSMESDEVGWDWLSIQLDDHSELMLYRLRHRNGAVDPYSSGTYVAADGRTLHLFLSDFTMTPSGANWRSPQTGTNYPIGWFVDVPKLKLQIEISTPLKTQEFVSRFGPSYWEGAIDLSGRDDNRPVRGSGYLEMTGYAEHDQLFPSETPR